jgi:hypothetical protein
LINNTSLSKTVDAIHSAHFEDLTLGSAERRQAARWMAARQGLPGAYGNTFAGFPSERVKTSAIIVLRPSQQLVAVIAASLTILLR